MRNLMLLAAGLLLISCTPTSVDRTTQVETEPTKAPGRYLVVLEEKAVAEMPVERLAALLAASYGLTVEGSAPGNRPGFLATLSEAARARLGDDPRVRVVEPVLKSPPMQEPRVHALTEPDTTPPTVSITSPAQGAVLTGTVTLSAQSSDNVRVYYVEFFLDGKSLGSSYWGVYPQGVSWDTHSTPNGVHTLTAVAWDDAHNSNTSAPVSVTVDQDVTPPTVSLSSPLSGATVTESMTVQGTAADDRALYVVRLFVDGSTYAFLSASPGNFATTVSTSNLSNGSHSLYAEARDTSGNITVTDPISITVNRDVTPPSVSLTVPTSAVTLTGGSLSLAADASDDRGLAKVAFLLDGYLLDEDTTPPFTATLNSDVFFNGDHTLVAKAYDLVGNVGTSAGVTVTVRHPYGAEFDPTLGAPVCTTVNDHCDSMSSLQGFNASELHSPNTLDACPDGQAAEYYAERVNRIVVRRLGGETLAENRRVRLDVLVPAPFYNIDQLDLYYASDARHPVWTYLTTLQPTPYGTQYLTTEYVLPAGALQAVRAQFRVGTPLADPATMPCSTGGYDDHDDLVFAVGKPTDGWSPTVQLTGPYSNALEGGLVTVTASAQGDLAVDRVEFFVDGALLSTDSSAPYEVSWNSASVADGSHTLTARAYDGSGYFGDSSAVVVRTDNTAPLAALVSPSVGALLRGNVTPTANASDANSVEKVEFYVDDALMSLRPIDANTQVWFSSDVADGSHTITVRARDSAGNVGVSAPVGVIVDNTPPSSDITSPADGAKLRGTVPVNITASDTNEVARVDLYAGDVLVGSDTTAPFSVNWDTTGAANGNVTLKVKAQDQAGNVSTTTFGPAVVVDNSAPTVSLTAPANGASVFLSTTLQASAADNMGVTQVVFYDGTKVLATDTTAPYSYSWSLLSVTKGNHTLTAKAYDAAGNVSTSAPITVKVN